MAAHLHDSVLQTLALVQRRRRPARGRRAGPPPGARAARLARRPPGAGPGGAARPRARGRGGRGRADPRRAGGGGRRRRSRARRGASRRVVAAAREAMTNAAKFGAGSPVDVYAETTPTAELQVFVRDRGPGFDAAPIPADRHGVRESIVGRMERHGGRARITSDAAARARRSSWCWRRTVVSVAARGHRRRPQAVPLRRARRARAAARDRWARRRRVADAEAAIARHRARRGAARRAHARRRRRRGDPARGRGGRPRAVSSPCRCPTPPRT